MSTIKSSSEDLTLNADGSNEVKFQINAVEKASINSSGLFTSTTIDATKLTGNLPAISGASLTGVGGAWTVIETQVANDDVSLTVSGLNSTYAMHVVTFSEMIPAVDATNPYLRFGDASGVDSGASDYQYMRHMIQEGSTSYDGAEGPGSGIMMGASVGTNAGEGWNGVFFMGGIGTGSVRPTIFGHWVSYTDSPEMRGGSIWGMRDAVITTDRINFFFSGGNITSGRMSVYGISHT